MKLGRNSIRQYFGVLPISPGRLAVVVLIVSAFQLGQRYTYHLTAGFDFAFSWVPVGFKIFLGNFIWAALSPVLLVLGQRIVSELKPTLRLAYRLGSILMLVLFQTASSLWLYNASFYFQSGYMREFFGANNMSELITGYLTALIEAVVIVGVFMALDYQKKLANKERDLAKAQLNALKMQLHPHFLFNTLHSISSMIDIDYKKAQHMITKVGDILRGMLSRNEDDFTTVKEEIDFIRNYLELEQVRFQDRMEIDFKVDEKVMDNTLPSLILQPLVENCIKHGVSKSRGHSRIEVEATTYQNGTDQVWLKLEINNSDDKQFRSSEQEGFGIGLTNVENRLKQNYGNTYYCKFEKIDGNHFKSELRLPLNHD